MPMDPLAAGSYDQWATLLDVPQTTRDEYGQPSQQAVPIGDFYVSIRPLVGAELVQERQIWANVSHIVRLPFTWDAIPPAPPQNPNGRIMPSMKFAVRKDRDAAPRYFNVLHALDAGEQGIEWECRCEEMPGSST